LPSEVVTNVDVVNMRFMSSALRRIRKLMRRKISRVSYVLFPQAKYPPRTQDQSILTSPSLAPINQQPLPQTPTKKPSSLAKMPSRRSPRTSKDQPPPMPITRVMPSRKDNARPASKQKVSQRKRKSTTPSPQEPNSKDSAPTTIQRKVSQTKRKSPPPSQKPNAKTLKEFQLDADNTRPDPLLMKTVAFDVDDKMYGTKLYEHFGGEEHAKKYISCTRNGKRILLGTVIRASKKKKGQSASTRMHYDIQWEQSDLGDTSIDLSLVIDAVALHQTISSTKRSSCRPPAPKPRNSDPFSPEVRNVLLQVDDTERGRPDSSEDEDTDNDDDEPDSDDLVFYPPRTIWP
jgi:hypothetical protein